MFSKRMYILVGNYGSGKTELSLSLARHLRGISEGRAALVDLDVVNPYFRSAEKRELLESEGIEVKAPSFAMTTVDIPALPADIQSVFDSHYERVVIDVGGDEVGAAALGRYAPYTAPMRSDICVMYVINAFRPMSSSAEDIEGLFSLIKARARIAPDVLVNNSNLQGLTTPDTLIEGQAVIAEAARRLNVPIGLVTGEEKLRAQLPPVMRSMFFPIVPLMRPEWLDYE